MCGICGIVAFDKTMVHKNRIQQMMDLLKHRGPDDEGMFLDGNLGLGHVRLSIIDLSSAGHQPMISSDGRYVMVYNGEIYNYKELREELASGGHTFVSKTDSEVLLTAYAEWGRNCLYRLNGMFAFVILDKKRKSLYGARDRFGIKPFYYIYNEEKFVFSSEIRPLLCHIKGRPEPDLRSVYDYLAFNRTDQTERTFFKGIRKLQHGHELEISDTRLKITKWYDLKENLKAPFSSPSQFRTAFSESLGLRLRSDVPVGVCLSGGVDSSSIVSLLLEDYQKHDLNTFSAVYKKGMSCDESKYIDLFMPKLTAMHKIYPTHHTLSNDIDNFIDAHAEPTPSTGPYAQFKVMELASKHVVVTLDGQGADEELAGYHYFYGYFFKELLCKFHWLKLILEMGFYLLRQKSLFGIKSFVFFLLPEKIQSKARINQLDYLCRDFNQNYLKGSVIAEELYRSKTLNDALINHFEYKLEHLLKWEDRNSMWFSLESRVPFLDHNLVERILALDPKAIISRGMTKSILRKSMKGVLPEAIRMRKGDVGFDTPEGDWFRSTPLRERISDIIHSDSFSKRGLIDAGRAQILFNQHLQGKLNLSKDIWKWINLELWFRRFVDP